MESVDSAERHVGALGNNHRPVFEVKTASEDIGGNPTALWGLRSSFTHSRKISRNPMARLVRPRRIKNYKED